MLAPLSFPPLAGSKGGSIIVLIFILIYNRIFLHNILYYNYIMKMGREENKELLRPPPPSLGRVNLYK